MLARPTLIATAVFMAAASDARSADPSRRQHQLFVAPEARADGSGADANNAAVWTDRAFWDEVRNRLATDDVVVIFLDGTYYVSSRNDLNMPMLSLSNLGHDEHHLTLQGLTPGGVTITRHPDDGTSRDEGSGLMRISRSRNMTLRYLHFTAPDNHWIGYATLIERSRNILIDSCSWIDMPNVHYGATGAHRAETCDIVYRNCTFVRIGRRSGAHMAYNAYAARRISYINCHFEDCAGDYIRFRSGTDFGVIAGCTFRSTGGHTNVHMPFISIPVFNDVDPGDEIFGSSFLIFGNSFIFETDERPDDRIAIRFLHRGFDPPGRRHLPDAREAEVLRSGSVEQKRRLLMDNLAVDAEAVRVYDNRHTNVEQKGVYDVRAAYGSESRGGDGRYDIFDTFNQHPAVMGTDDALEFFRGECSSD